jgi:hypothetical protein
MPSQGRTEEDHDGHAGDKTTSTTATVHEISADGRSATDRFFVERAAANGTKRCRARGTAGTDAAAFQIGDCNTFERQPVGAFRLGQQMRDFSRKYAPR